ncbi:MAG: hypothetical protein ACPLRH_03510 [Desulfotomaculales bacterium]
MRTKKIMIYALLVVGLSIGIFLPRVSQVEALGVRNDYYHIVNVINGRIYNAEWQLHYACPSDMIVKAFTVTVIEDPFSEHDNSFVFQIRSNGTVIATTPALEEDETATVFFSPVTQVEVYAREPGGKGGFGIDSQFIFLAEGTVADVETVVQARDAANNAATYAQNAYTAANNAASYASSAKTYASNAATYAQNAYTAASTAANNTTYNGQSAAYWAYQAAQGGVDTTPPTIQKVGGQNGATCTTTSTFYVVVQATDNKTGQLQARAQVDGGTWTGWYNIPQNAIPVSLSSVGAHTITVEVKDVAGNSSQATMTAFRV